MIRRQQFWFLWCVLLIAAPCHAATVTKSIGSGKDYASITLWEADSYGATASDDAVGELYGTVIENPVINDSTPLSITLHPAAGEEHHGYQSSGGAQIVPVGSANAVLYIETPMSVEGLEIWCSDAGVHGIQVVTGSCTVDKCIVWGAESTVTLSLIRISSGIGNVITNNVCCDSSCASSANIIGIYLNPFNTTKCINNTVVTLYSQNGLATGIWSRDDSDQELRNNLVVEITTTTGSAICYNQSSPLDQVHSNNISDDATSPDTSFRNKTITFRNPSYYDYHLAAGETDAIDQGSTDPDVPDDDIDYEERDASPDIGMDEYVSEGILIFQQSEF